MPPSFIIPTDSELFRILRRVSESQRMVFFAGLPGVGKSLLIQQLSQLAHASGRQIHILQWDVARTAFETDAILARYPEVDGVTHNAIRKAAGLWSRNAVLQWHHQHPDRRNLLIGETPLIGNRLIELAKSQEDEAEVLLRDERTRFIIPVPSREIRRVIENARHLSSADPQHERERADAAPKVMSGLWRELYDAAFALGVTKTLQERDSVEYDPDVCQRVYDRILKHRHHEAAHLNTALDTGNRSVYDLEMSTHELVPSEDEASAFIEKVENLYPDEQKLEQETRAWYLV